MTLACAYLALLAACATGAVGLAKLPWLDPANPALPWWGFAAALPGLAGVALRHRSTPAALVLVAASTLGSAALGFSVGVFVFLFELLFSLVLVAGPRGPRWARTLAAGLSAAAVGGTALSGAGLGAVLSSALLAAVALWLPVLWAGDLRLADRLRAAESERADAAAAAASAREQLAVERERQHMAGELHDTVSGHLSAIALQAQAAALTADEAARSRALEQMRAGSVEALEQMRALIEVLQAGRPQPEATGTLADLPALADRARAAGHAVFLEQGHDGAGLAPAAEAAVFRAASEGVTNTLKHAPGSALSLRLTAGPEPGGGRVSKATDTGSWPLVLEVENGPAAVPDSPDAVAANPAAPGSAGNGLGLAQLRSRFEALGGSLAAGPSPSGGWLLRASLPQADAAAPAAPHTSRAGLGSPTTQTLPTEGPAA